MAKRAEIYNMQMFNAPEGKLFRLYANGIQLQVTCTIQEWVDDFDNTLKKVNENFRNSIRYIKYYGKLPKKPDLKKMNAWTKGETGISMKVKNDPLPEFQPFSF